jgi:hypothetical protein
MLVSWTNRDPSFPVRHRSRLWICLVSGAAAAALLVAAAPIPAAQNVSVGVNAGEVTAVMPDVGIGLHTSVYANNFTQSTLPAKLADGGIQLLRYPGGNYADIYHWSNHTATGGYAASGSHFGNFVTRLMEGSGAQAMITIDYGASHQATMGGQPKEAAAWVAYANGDPGDTTVIGVDDEGNDWRTVGYWATLRGMTAAQNPDNQYDFLAINHDDPIGIQYWEIGNELNGNGYYGGDGWQYDLHAPYDGNRYHNPALSPAAYATHFNEFAAAMKAVDPTIKVGAVMVGSGYGNDSDPAYNWDKQMLPVAGPNMDFGIYHYYPGDWGASASDNTVNVLNATDDLPAEYDLLRNRIETYVGAGESDRIELHMTEFGYFGSVDNSTIDGVYSANTFATALEDGITSVHWLELSAGSYLGDGYPTPGGAYYGTQIFSHIAETGSDFVETTSSNGDVETHATVLPDGSVGILIANLASGSSNDANVSINVSGALLADSGTSWLYGENQTTPLETSITSGLGNSFTVAVPYRSILALLIPSAAPLPGDYNGDNIVDAADYTVWRDHLGESITLPNDVTPGTVDPGDFDVWKQHFGQMLPPGSGALAAAVFEPSTCLLAGMALVGLAAIGRRRTSSHFKEAP